MSQSRKFIAIFFLLTISVLTRSYTLAATPAKIRSTLSDSTMVMRSSDVDTSVAVVVRNDGDEESFPTIAWANDNSIAITPKTANCPVQGHSLSYRVFHIKGQLPLSGVQLKATVETQELQLNLSFGQDLTDKPWKMAVSNNLASSLESHWNSPEFNDASWTNIQLPSAPQEGRFQWYRHYATFPKEWQGVPIWLEIGAVDDNDLTYVNGQQVGKGAGWDVRRRYLIPQAAIRWGEPNLITIVADNPSAGGGIYTSPIRLILGPNPFSTNRVPKGQFNPRPKPSPVGQPLPFRPTTVENGILRYNDGSEVSLFGVNYYPQSWYHYTALAEGGYDHKKVMDEDFAHMKKMGVEVIRIHVFDTEISDSSGNLINNIHLDLLDYLISKAQQHGMYVFMTPIAWWGSPNQRSDAFSVLHSKVSLPFNEQALTAQKNYIKQLLSHKNRYTGHTYVDEPNLCAFELVNEPAYPGFEDITTIRPNNDNIQDVVSQWQKWLASKSLPPTEGSYYLFTYESVKSWLNSLFDAAREAGAKQPIAAPSFGYQWGSSFTLFGDSVKGEAIAAAVADSKCEALTLGDYPGGLTSINDRKNLLSEAANASLPSLFNPKARFVYEFDAAGTMLDNYLYLAMARKWRSLGVQIACQFQYDSAVLSNYNSAWGTHFLNYLYTPGKAAAILAAEEAFDKLPRETPYRFKADDQVFGEFAVSYRNNLAVHSSIDSLLHSNTVPENWSLVSTPNNPKEIIGVGNSPLIEYDGTGLYSLKVTDNQSIRVEINPNVTYVRHPLDAEPGPVAELDNNFHNFTIKRLGDVTRTYHLYKLVDNKEVDALQSGTTFKVQPGSYILR